MKYLETPHERKSALLTTIIALLLLLLFSLVGLKYFDPPIDYGMEVNFGTTAVGQGKQEQTPKAIIPPAPKPQPRPAAVQSSKSPKKALTQREKSIPVAEKKKTQTSAAPKKQQQKPTPTKTASAVVETPPAPVQPKVADKTKNLLAKMLNAKAQPAPTQQGEGNDEQPGNKGKTTGNPYANTYYGNAGLGGQGQGFGLSGRSLQSNGSVTQQCNQEGVVVVRIRVNQQGQVIEAEPGVKGSTNVHPCLLEPAKKTAFLHQWFPDADAPSVQVGFVVVNFKLSE